MSDRPEATEENPAAEPHTSPEENQEPGPEQEPRMEADDGSAGLASREKFQDFWPELRKLLVFQVKLYVDALRDLLMSPLSIVIFIADLVQGNRGDNTLFESLLQFGRRTEHAINLFNQHEDAEAHRSIDAILVQVEEVVRREFKDGSVSEKTRDSVEKSLNKLRDKLQESAAARRDKSGQE